MARPSVRKRASPIENVFSLASDLWASRRMTSEKRFAQGMGDVAPAAPEAVL